MTRKARFFSRMARVITGSPPYRAPGIRTRLKPGGVGRGGLRRAGRVGLRLRGAGGPRCGGGPRGAGDGFSSGSGRGAPGRRGGPPRPRPGAAGSPGVRGERRDDLSTGHGRHVQVDVQVVALDAAQHLVGERVRQQHLEGVGEVLAGVGQRLEGRGERLEVGDHVGFAPVDRVDRHRGEGVEGAQHGQQGAALLLQDLQSGAEAGEDRSHVLFAGGEGGGEPVDAVERLGDVALVRVQVRDEGVDPLQYGADLRFLPGERLVQLGGDGLELVDAAPVEEHGQGAEDLFDLGVPVGAGERDAARARERSPCGALGGAGRAGCTSRRGGWTVRAGRRRWRGVRPSR